MLLQIVAIAIGAGVAADPPFQGTVWDINADIVTPSDPSTLLSLDYTGRGLRTMFDRRPNAWIEDFAWLFHVAFEEGPNVEIQVNSEFGTRQSAEEQARRYAPLIGQLPPDLRTELQTVWIHRGDEPFGGGNNNILIHTGYAEATVGDYIIWDYIEEVFLHEAAHTTLDPHFKDDPRWLNAQQADGEFISTYARDYPQREDIAESLVPWIAVRYRLGRIDDAVAEAILATIPNRLAFFDSLNLNMSLFLRTTATTPSRPRCLPLGRRRQAQLMGRSTQTISASTLRAPRL